MYENVLIFIYSIFYKLTDDFDDEEIYNLYFPNGKIIIYSIFFSYTIYLFYFKDYNSYTYLFLFVLEFWYLLILILKYFNSFLVILGEMKLTLKDPFTLLTIIKLPMFIYKFNYIFKFKMTNFVFLNIIFIIIGVFQDIDNSIIGTYILNNKYKNNKTCKIIYRIFLVLFLTLCYTFIDNNVIKLPLLFLIGYFGTSVYSLILQLFLEDDIENKKFYNKLNNLIKYT